ncbi:MAG: phytoene/squalene synthase family protein [Planctomycetota bacterium]
MPPAPPPASDDLAASYAHCRRVARKQARNFYYGMRLTPEPKRSALYTVYAYMRACDDFADDLPPDADASAARDRIEAFRHHTHAVLDGRVPPDDDAMWPAFRDTCARYTIASRLLDDMLDGQIADLTPARYKTFDDLYNYCYQVASTVGLVCLAVWGHDGEKGVAKLAEHRGIALQLTNILRDVAEDAQRGRVYLPAEDLERFDLTPKSLAAGHGGDGFDRFMQFQVQRARSYYQSSAALEQHLSPDCRSSCWALMRVYQGLLDRIAANPSRVLTQRVSLSPFSKLGVMFTALTRRSWPTVQPVAGTA